MLIGCTWVKRPPGAEHIVIASSAQAAACTRLGQVRSSVRDRVAGVQRRAEQVAEELETLARTSAMELGGDTLVPLGPVRNGAREYSVHRCRDDGGLTIE
ncbi:MAG: DUF4156 domain-containing protein [Wenzhouxiangellaceae bacterium]